MAAPRRGTRGIVAPQELLTRVRLRRHEPAPPLRRYVENYWFLDWDLSEPYASHIVPHPSVNVTFERYGDESPATTWDEPVGVVTGVALGLFTRKLTGRGRVCGVKFRSGGFRPFAPDVPVLQWTGQELPVHDVFASAPADIAETVTGPDDEHARVAALDAFLLGLGAADDPQADLAITLVDLIRSDATVHRVGDFAAAQSISVRALQRLFSAYVGVGPKWVILRHRIHQALERADSEAAVDWAALAADLGYADQAHLVRDFTATVGVPPTAYAPQTR
ncbi:helix-turn-helix domain-containing protein [Streptomyces sp. NPDC046821]|uniref:helix-turn-helix domain-containing protein n=1 Tax=Streptomyces sp. NPDC046821 TaxID=3154702 RepID=UPI003409EA34